MTTDKRITIAIDGPAGAGKSTVSRGVARALGYSLVDTGAIYRSVALMAERDGISWEDQSGLAQLVERLDIDFTFVGESNRISVNGEDLSALIRTPDISRGASIVSRHPMVRAGLLTLQRAFAGEGGTVLEGRDIGTVVCPDAPVKVFLDASPEVRARRRVDELVEKGLAAKFEEVLEEIRDRDDRDRNREHAPLKAADDATLLDSSSISAEQVIEKILKLVDAARGASEG
jgi:cytidylate kinase